MENKVENRVKEILKQWGTEFYSEDVYFHLIRRLFNEGFDTGIGDIVEATAKAVLK